MEAVRIRDPGWKKVGSGIRDKHPGSSTLSVLRIRDSGFFLTSVSDPYSFFPNPDPEVEAGDQYGTGSNPDPGL